MENHVVTMQNHKKEDKLYLRVAKLEEENKQLLKTVKNLMVKQENDDRRLELYREQNIFEHNTMVATINTIISELNNVITIILNQNQEN